MPTLQFHLPYQATRHRLLLADLLDELAARGVTGELLLRASEQAELPRLLEHGTTRGGFVPGEPWRDGAIPGRIIAHEDVLFGTTPEEILQGEDDAARSTSFKKLPGMRQPMVQVYDRGAFERIADRQYLFRAPRSKRAALLAIALLQRCAPIPGWFSDAAGQAYRELLRPLRGGVAVEVGVWAGLSLSHVGRLARINGTRLVGVDHWQGSNDAYADAYRERLAGSDIEAQCRAGLAALGIEVDLVRAASIDAARGFAPASVDLVFLDGSHDPDSVRADLDAWAPTLRRGGRLAGHDHAPRHPGVVAAVDAFATERGWPLRVDPSSVWVMESPR